MVPEPFLTNYRIREVDDLAQAANEIHLKPIFSEQK
jgi:hypothetical protein